MRGLALALISAAALAACNPSASFPNLSNGHYRTEATVTTDAGPLPVVMLRDGDKMRIEFNNPQGQMAVINGGASGESFVLVTRDGQTIAMRSGDHMVEDPAKGWNAEVASTATRTGSCSAAGENGSEWTHTGDDGVARAACITNDGIILRSKEGERTVWETTSVSRGPQDAAQFVLPPGVQVMDLGAMMEGLGGLAAQAGAAAEADGGPHVSPELCQTLRNAGAPASALSQAGC